MKSEEVLAVVKKGSYSNNYYIILMNLVFLVETHNLIQSCMKVKYTPLKGGVLNFRT